MAEIKIDFPDNLLKELVSLSLGTNLEKVIEEVLQAGAKVVKEEEARCLDAILKDDERSRLARTGQLENALGITSVKVDKKGNSNIKIGFAPNRKDGENNAKIANIIEYGSVKMKARPFVKVAKKNSKDKCRKAMINEYDRQIGKFISK